MAYYQTKLQYQVNKNYYQIYYEDLINNPSDVLSVICEKTSLDFSYYFAQRIISWQIRQGTNEAWRNKLTYKEQLYLTSLLEQPLEEMKYEI